MGDEHLSTISATELDESIKTSVENLVPIPRELKGIFDDTCDVPVGEDSSTFDALSDHSEILSDSNNDGTSSDDDSYENIEYVEASPLNLEIISLEEVNKDQEEKDHLITNIKSLKDNPTPDHVFKSSFSFPIPVTDSDSFFEKSDTSFFFDNSLPKFETFSDHTEETRSGSTTTHANNSLPEYDSFLFEVEPDQGRLISIVISNNSNDPLLELPEFESFHFDSSFPRPSPEPPDVEISLIIETDAPVINNFDELNEDECFDLGGDEINVEIEDSFTFVLQTFLPFLTYPEVSPLLSSTENEDTIFDPGHLHLEPVASHRDGTFMCLNVYLNINERSIEIFSSIYFLQGRMNSGIESSYVTRLPKTKRFVGGTPCLSIFYFLSYFSCDLRRLVLF
ncbi:hypothetical protein Tco_0883626 [Tanacetum coccineum]